MRTSAGSGARTRPGCAWGPGIPGEFLTSLFSQPPPSPTPAPPAFLCPLSSPESGDVPSEPRERVGTGRIVNVSGSGQFAGPRTSASTCGVFALESSPGHCASGWPPGRPGILSLADSILWVGNVSLPPHQAADNDNDLQDVGFVHSADSRQDLSKE